MYCTVSGVSHEEGSWWNLDLCAGRIEARSKYLSEDDKMKSSNVPDACVQDSSDSETRPGTREL